MRAPGWRMKRLIWGGIVVVMMVVVVVVKVVVVVVVVAVIDRASLVPVRRGSWAQEH